MFIVFYLVHWGWRWDLDLEVYRAAGHSLHAGSDPYLAVFTNSRLPFTYPPFALLLLSPLSLGTTGIVEAGWWVVNAAALVAILYLALRSALGTGARRAFALAAALGGAATMALEPLRSNMDYGQINLLIMLLVIIDITRVRAPWRGLLVGVAAAVKLTPLVYLVYFLIDRDRRSGFRGVGAFVGATAVGWLVLPSDSVRYWWHDAFAPGRTGTVGSITNQSWDGLVHRAPFYGDTAGTILWVGAEISTVLVAVIVARRYVAARRVVDAVSVLALTELLKSFVDYSDTLITV
jgi:alpha-1,2-mannosyltransferase